MALFLVSKGIPFDVAFALHEHEAQGYYVILGELEGGQYDWGTMSWIRSD